MHVFLEQIKLTFKINVKSHPWYEGRQPCSSGKGRDILRWAVEANSPPSFWPSICVPFYLLKSNNKLVIRGHLLPPDNTYSEQELSVGERPGILAAVGSSSFVECFTPCPEPAHGSPGPAAGRKDTSSLRHGPLSMPAGVHVWRSSSACSSSLTTPPPQPQAQPPRCRGSGTLGMPPGQGVEQLGKTCCAALRAWLCLFLPSAFPGGAIHAPFLAPKPPRLKKNIQGDSVWAESECQELFPKVVAVGNVYLWVEQSRP